MITECDREEGTSVGPAVAGVDTSSVDGQGVDGWDVENMATTGEARRVVGRPKGWRTQRGRAWA